MDTNSGTSGTKASGSSWVGSGTIWDGDSHTQYSSPTASSLFTSWGLTFDMNIGWAGFPATYTRNITAPSSTVLKPTTRSVSNTASSWGCINCSLSGTTATNIGNYASNFFTIFRPSDQDPNSSSYFRIWFADTTGNNPGGTPWTGRAWLQYACGNGSAYQGNHAEESNRFMYQSSTTYYYQRLAGHPEVNDTYIGELWNGGGTGTKATWYYAGEPIMNSYRDPNLGGAQYGGYWVIQTKFYASSSCKNYWPNYSVGATYHTIYYRPRIRVKYT